MLKNQPNTQIEENTQPVNFSIYKAIPGFVFVILFPAACLLLISGQYRWWEAWVLIIGSGIVTITGRLLLIRKYPDLANERADSRDKSGTQTWDKKLMPIVAILGPLVIWIVAGLDKRFQASTTLPITVEIIAMLVILFAYIFSTWAMLVNQFFSAIVRIQNDRGHKVINSGPYRIVRHPGYAGSLIAFLFLPLCLSTFWAYLPTLFVIAAVFVRTAKEDRFLQAELPGYTEYAQQIRFRLIPGIW